MRRWAMPNRALFHFEDRNRETRRMTKRRDDMPRITNNLVWLAYTYSTSLLCSIIPRTVPRLSCQCRFFLPYPFGVTDSMRYIVKDRPEVGRAICLIHARLRTIWGLSLPFEQASHVVHTECMYTIYNQENDRFFHN